MFLFYLREKSRRGYGGHILGAQVLREWENDKGLCPLGSRDEDSFVTVKLDPLPFWVGYLYHGTPGSIPTGGNILSQPIWRSSGTHVI